MPPERGPLHTAIGRRVPIKIVQVGDVPPALDDLIMQCLEKGPAMRPASMEEVEQRLEAILHRRPVETPVSVAAVAPRPRPVRAMRARRRLIAGGALAGIAAIAVVGLLSLEAGTASVSRGSRGRRRPTARPS